MNLEFWLANLQKVCFKNLKLSSQSLIYLQVQKLFLLRVLLQLNNNNSHNSKHNLMWNQVPLLFKNLLFKKRKKLKATILQNQIQLKIKICHLIRMIEETKDYKACLNISRKDLKNQKWVKPIRSVLKLKNSYVPEIHRMKTLMKQIIRKMWKNYASNSLIKITAINRKMLFMMNSKVKGLVLWKV